MAVRVVVLSMRVGQAPGAPTDAEAQVPSWKDVQVADIETMRDKFTQLAEAFSQEQYEWRPMDGVRSVAEVLGLTIAEAHLFPTAWGLPPAAAAARGFQAEVDRASALSRPDMIRELGTSFAYLLEVVEGMDEAKRTSDGSYFGDPMPVHASIATAMNDMHEHLGQLIAYARSNHVVPPWSG